MCSQLGVLQLACAALEALDHKGNHHRDKIYATEKVRLYHMYCWSILKSLNSIYCQSSFHNMNKYCPALKGA